MGATASVYDLPFKLDFATIQSFPNRPYQLHQYVFNAHEDKEGYIPRRLYLELIGAVDLFFSYELGFDNTGNSIKERVLRVIQYCKKLGYTSWDLQKQTEPILKSSSSPVVSPSTCTIKTTTEIDIQGVINRSQIVLIFITKPYLDSIAGKNDSNICKKSFHYIQFNKSSSKVITILMDSNLKDSKKLWYGPAGMLLQSKAHIDFTNEKYFETVIRELHRRVSSMITPIKYLDIDPYEMAEMLPSIDSLFPNITTVHLNDTTKLTSTEVGVQSVHTTTTSNACTTKKLSELTAEDVRKLIPHLHLTGYETMVSAHNITGQVLQSIASFKDCERIFPFLFSSTQLQLLADLRQFQLHGVPYSLLGLRPPALTVKDPLVPKAIVGTPRTVARDMIQEVLLVSTIEEAIKFLKSPDRTSNPGSTAAIFSYHCT